jgi:hypothetical protein
MKITKWIFALFIFCNLMISCDSISNEEDDALFFTEDVSGTDNGETPIPPDEDNDDD